MHVFLCMLFDERLWNVSCCHFVLSKALSGRKSIREEILDASLTYLYVFILMMLFSVLFEILLFVQYDMWFLAHLSR